MRNIRNNCTYTLQFLLTLVAYRLLMHITVANPWPGARGLPHTTIEMQYSKLELSFQNLKKNAKFLLNIL